MAFSLTPWDEVKGLIYLTISLFNRVLRPSFVTDGNTLESTNS